METTTHLLFRFCVQHNIMGNVNEHGELSLQERKTMTSAKLADFCLGIHEG